MKIAMKVQHAPLFMPNTTRVTKWTVDKLLINTTIAVFQTRLTGINWFSLYFSDQCGTGEYQIKNKVKPPKCSETTPSWF